VILLTEVFFKEVGKRRGGGVPLQLSWYSKVTLNSKYNKCSNAMCEGLHIRSVSIEFHAH